MNQEKIGKDINIIIEKLEKGKYLLFYPVIKGKGRFHKPTKDLKVINKYINRTDLLYEFVDQPIDLNNLTTYPIKKGKKVKVNKSQNKKSFKSSVHQHIDQNLFCEETEIPSTKDTSSSTLDIVIEPSIISQETTYNDDSIKTVLAEIVDSHDNRSNEDNELKSVALVQGNNNIDDLDLINVGLNQKSSKFIPTPKNVLFDLNEEQYSRFVSLFNDIKRLGNNQIFLNWMNMRFLEAIAARTKLNIQAIDLIKYHPVLMAYIWKEDSSSHPLIIHVQDHASSEYFVYSENNKSSTVPYLSVTENEVLKIISSYIIEFFNGQPPMKIGSVEFARSVLNELLIDITINKEKLEEKLPPGIACKNGYFCSMKGQNLIDFIPYSKETFVTKSFKGNPPIYCLTKESIEIYIEHLGEKIMNETQIDKESSWMKRYEDFDQVENLNPLDAIKRYINQQVFTDFINVITEEDEIKIMSLRSIIQRVILSPREGRNYQQCFWLWGNAGTAKSTWAEIAKMFAQGSTMELSKSHNQFTSLSFKGKKLLLISDVERMPKDMIESLRTILGRDQLYYEVKHQNVFDFIEPFCQVIIVSNKSPDQFPLIWERIELREKITPLQFSHPIPQRLMISNLKDYLDKMAFALFLWAMFTPRFFLKQQTRGRLLKRYMEEKGTQNKTLLNYFIEEKLYVSDSQARIYVAKDELRNEFEAWATENGSLSDINDKLKFLLYLPRNLINLLITEYKIPVEEKRLVVNKLRVLALSGITLNPKSEEGLDNARIELPKDEAFDFGGLDPLTDVTEMEGPQLVFEDFHSIQREILTMRHQDEINKNIKESDN